MNTALPAIERSLRIATPSWPLQNTVAVNPFWFHRDGYFQEVLNELAPAIHASLFMPMEFFLEQVRSGKITETALERALNLTSARATNGPRSVPEFLVECRQTLTTHSFVNALSESRHVDSGIHGAISADIGKYCAAYLDERQAIAPFPWQNLPFWRAWLTAQEYDSSLERLIPVDKESVLAEFGHLNAEDAIAFMFDRLELPPGAHVAYLERLTATVLGWSSQFKYCEWQRSLGYEVKSLAETKDLLAVRMAYEYLLARSLRATRPDAMKDWARHFPEGKNEYPRRDERQAILQLAAELSYQESVSDQIAPMTGRRSNLPSAQFAFCIDVRSEIFRRHLESSNSNFQTIGFAGFFGAPFDYRRVGDRQAGHRLPVLLTPAFKVSESSREKEGRVSSRLRNEKVQSYFRRLRKNPISSFLYVELFGALSIEKMMSKTFHALADRFRRHAVPERFESEFGPDLETMKSLGGTPTPPQEKIERAAGALKHLGLTQDFAELVWIVGHGSVTTNNAFASSLDCGACGGHAGDINARMIVDLLNEHSIRKGLKDLGIFIPADTWFIAAVHETVTDEVYALDFERIPERHREKVKSIGRKLRTASKSANRERLERLPLAERDPFRRASNWSEVRPEWGLTGNACFIVAPRERTSGVNLGSRSFLHDYDWKKDEASGYKTLELIMTAPMVVTNWINLQYYASTVAPKVYGSGNKLLHNLTNECGVVEGNGGDLRIGLPFQSVHNGNRFMHEPLRLSVYIEAPRAEIEKIIARHETVRDLVEKGWLHLLHIEPGSPRISLRTSGGEYRDRLESVGS